MTLIREPPEFRLFILACVREFPRPSFPDKLVLVPLIGDSMGIPGIFPGDDAIIYAYQCISYEDNDYPGTQPGIPAMPTNEP